MADVLLTDEEFLRYVTRAVALQIEFGFVREEDREAEIDALLEKYCRRKPYVDVH